MLIFLSFSYDLNVLEVIKFNKRICKQKIYVDQRGTSKNLLLQGKTFNGSIVIIVDGTNDCFLKNNDCKTSDELEGLIQLHIKQLPIIITCGSKINGNINNEVYKLRVSSLNCETLWEQLSSDQSELVDDNLETCHYFVNPLIVNINNPEASSVDVYIWMKEKFKYPSCNQFEVWKKSSDSECDHKNYQFCEYTSESYSHHIYGKNCIFNCKKSIIQNILITIKPKISLVYDFLEICEISIMYLDLSN